MASTEPLFKEQQETADHLIRYQENQAGKFQYLTLQGSPITQKQAKAKNLTASHIPNPNKYRKPGKKNR